MGKVVWGGFHSTVIMLSDACPTSNLAAPAVIYASCVCLLESFIDHPGCAQVDCFVQNVCLSSTCCGTSCLVLPCTNDKLQQMGGLMPQVCTDQLSTPPFLLAILVMLTLCSCTDNELGHVCSFSSGSLCVYVCSSYALTSPKTLVLVMK